MLACTMCLSACSLSASDFSNIDPDKYITAVNGYKGLTIEAQKQEITDEVLENEIQSMLESYSELAEVSGKTLEMGDIANINYEGKIDGVAFDGGSNMGQEGYDLEIGSGVFIPGFENALIGMKAGETKDITVTFPEQYGAENLAGKEAVFTVVLNSIKTKSMPELTDEFVAGLQLTNVTTVEGYKTYLRKKLEDDAQNNYEQQLSSSAMIKMLDAFEFTDEIPEERYKYYYDNIVNMDKQYAEQFQIDLDQFVTLYYGFENTDAYYKWVEDSSMNAVRVDLASVKILKDEGIKITDKDVEEDILANLENYGVSSVEEFKQSYNIDDYKSSLINKKAAEIIVSNANIVAPETTAE